MVSIDNERCAIVFNVLSRPVELHAMPPLGARSATWPAYVERPQEWIESESLLGLSLAVACQVRAAKLRGEGREEEARTAEETHRQAVLHLKQNLYLQGHLKRELSARLPLEDAAAIIAHALGSEHAPHLGRARLRTMRDYVREHGLFYAEIESPKAFLIAWPKVFGSFEGQAVEAIGRIPFVGVVPDATIRHRSSLVRVGENLLLDAQSEELTEIPVQLHVDPNVMDRYEEDIVTFDPERGSALELHEAVHLGGVPSRAFGHWVAQFLLKYFAARMSGVLPPVPILIDGEIPKTHREALEFFLADEVEIVVLPDLGSAHVSRLWLLGDWLYVPVCPAPGQDLGPRRLSLPPQATADIVRGMLAGRGLKPSVGSSRLFLARRPTQHRKMVNHLQIEEIARRRGFRVVHLEDYSFAEQMALIRDAKEIVGPDGSSHIMCMFANPGTKLTMLSHGFMENNASLMAVLDAIGLDVLMLQGRCVREDSGYKRFSDYEIEPVKFEEALSRCAPDTNN